MKHTATRIVFSYWDRLRGERAAPERGEIEPGEIRHALADTFILELMPGTGTGLAEIRLAGTRLCALFGGELRGRRFADLWAEAARGEVEHCIDTVVDETAGVVAGIVGHTAEGDRLGLELILLPLRHRGRTYTRVLGVLSPAQIPPWIGLRSIAGMEVTGLRVISPPPSPGPGFARPLAPLTPVPVGLADPRRRFVVHQGGRA